MAANYATIPIKPATKSRLDQFGRKNQTYDELVCEILNKITGDYQ
jgi:hypothetical protein